MISNSRFNGTIGGKKLNDYKNKVVWDLKTYEERLEHINKIFDLDQYGLSKEDFWTEIWDMGICKATLNKTDTLWSDTDIASFLDGLGSYLMYGYKPKEKYNNEYELSDNLTTDDIMLNDKNYRLAPKDKVKTSDYSMRELFKDGYEEYVNTVSKTIYEVKSEDSFDRIKHNELEKIKLLSDSQRNILVLKEQMNRLKNGERLQFCKEEKIYVKPMNLNIDLSVQLKRFGLDNSEIEKIENKTYSSGRYRPSNVTLYHITSHLKDLNYNMLECKLAYTNRVKIKPSKCSTNYDVLSNVDYLEPTHIKGMLRLMSTTLEPNKDMSIIAYDINKKIKDMYSNKELSDRDMYILEGIKYNISETALGKELGVDRKVISKNINRICLNIANSFYKDYLDCYFMYIKKGKYKKCSKCDEIKLLREFNKNARRKDGKETFCKRCQRK